MPECDNNCSSCGVEGCPSRDNGIVKSKPHALSSFKKTIAVVSGKGGVGKSLVTSLLGVYLRREGKEVAILDADVTGPSIPRAFGTQKEQASGEEGTIYSIKTKTGIKLMSAGYLLEEESDPVIWRGPMIAQMVTTLYSETVFGECDYLLIDLPPGTGDVPLTVFQSLNVDGIVVVASPQELVGIIVEKALRMAKMMDIKVIGLVGNMCYLECPDCGKKIYPYGRSRLIEASQKYDVPLLDELPIDPLIAEEVDKGQIESVKDGLLKATIDTILSNSLK